MHNNRGFGIIEVVIALGAISILIVSIGKVSSSVNRIDRAAADRTVASSLACEPIEILSKIKNSLFACICTGNGSCANDVCTRTSDGQSCTLPNGYDSCWTEYPDGSEGSSFFYLTEDGVAWSLMPLQPGNAETIASAPEYKRVVAIENALRDASGNIAANGTPDFNTKHIISTVSWQEAGEAKNLDMEIYLTAWKDL